MINFCSGFLTLINIGYAISLANMGTNAYMELEKQDFTVSNLTANILDWETDLAIMFYAPWCKHCKQLKPSWETIQYLASSKKDLVVTRFNCEQPQSNADVCAILSVDRYPTVMFIGYGNFNQAPINGFIFGKSRTPRIVRYTADIYPEAVYDWILTLHFISKLQIWWDDLKGLFTGRSRAFKRMERLQSRLDKAEKKASLFGKELEKYKANEIFDALEFLGDPFPLLHQLDPDEQNLPLRVCVADMAAEYCRYYPMETYCQLLGKCSSQNLVPKYCRPEKCPFESSRNESYYQESLKKNTSSSNNNKEDVSMIRGCKVVSTCMQKSVIEEYKKLLTK